MGEVREGIGHRQGECKAGPGGICWQNSHVTHGFMSWEGHLELALTHCWDGSLKLGHNGMWLIS